VTVLRFKRHTIISNCEKRCFLALYFLRHGYFLALERLDRVLKCGRCIFRWFNYCNFLWSSKKANLVLFHVS
jgi:hypothetical protein